MEQAVYKGSSDSRLLLEMVIEYFEIQVRYNFTILITHVSGKRMIACGSDGLSRGSTNEGIMNGEDFLSFLPLHLSALERSPQLKDWICDWTGNTKDVIFLEPEDWFVRGHDIAGSDPDPILKPNRMWNPLILSGTYIWTPHPAAADVALEELSKARMKRHNSTHIVIIPRMFTNYWRKQFHKCCDLILDIPAHFNFWNHDMFEPLLIGFCFPYLKHFPYSIRNTPKLFSLGGELSKMFKDDSMDPRNLLSKLPQLSRSLPTMPKRLVRRLLYFEQSC